MFQSGDDDSCNSTQTGNVRHSLYTCSAQRVRTIDVTRSFPSIGSIRYARSGGSFRWIAARLPNCCDGHRVKRTVQMTVLEDPSRKLLRHLESRDVFLQANTMKIDSLEKENVFCSLGEKRRISADLFGIWSSLTPPAEDDLGPGAQQSPTLAVESQTCFCLLGYHDPRRKWLLQSKLMPPVLG